jgi:hypothetical protein
MSLEGGLGGGCDTTMEAGETAMRLGDTGRRLAMLAMEMS